MLKFQVESQSGYPALDETTPWFEWLSYTECCASLNVRPSLTRFLRYNAYYRSIQNEQN
jgi:hypothetical protein